MRRTWLAERYAWAVGALGLSFWVWSVVQAAPWATRYHDLTRGTLPNTAILLVLALLSAFSPIQTRAGVLTVTLGPLFGAATLQGLPLWAIMTVAALGTIDKRVPGKEVPWSIFTFNRGMYIFTTVLPAMAFQGTGGQLWSYGVALVMMLGLNTVLVATLFSLRQGTTLLDTIRHGLSGNGFTYFALPLTGILIAQLVNRSFPESLIVFLLYGPLLIYRASIQKQRRLDTWLRDSYIMQSRVVDKRDGQTHGHSQRVGELSETVARILRLPDEVCNTIRVGGVLHDLGKIAIPDSILLKPSKLTPEEYEVIKTHPVEGAAILAEHPEQQDVSLIVRHHHEKWDGTGYPDGLKSEAIPIGSRIVNACDAFDTITQARVFRPTVRTPAEAIKELRQLAGTWYDPDVITALEKIVAERWSVEIDHPELPLPIPAGYRDALAVRPFRLLWLGQAVSYFGDTMNTAGLAIMLFFLTHSASVVALGLIAKAAPTILFGLIAGPLVDRFNRQRLMILADLLRAFLTVIIPFLAMHWLPGVLIDVFVIASASAFFNPAKQAIIPNLVPSKVLVKANSLISSSEKTMELLGYSAAGVIAATISWIPLFLIDAGTYLYSAISLLGVPDMAARQRRRLKLLADVAEGMRYVVSNATLRATMALTLVATVFFGMTVTVLVVLSYRQLNAGPSGYGFLEAAIGAGAIVGSFAAAELMGRQRAGILLLVGVAGVGLSNLLVGFTHDLWAAIVILLFGGILNMIYYVPTISVTQREAPDSIRGRVMSTRFLVVQGGFLLGMATAGPLSDHVGVGRVFIFGGAALIIAAVLGMMFKSLRDASMAEEVSPVLKATAAG